MKNENETVLKTNEGVEGDKIIAKFMGIKKVRGNKFTGGLSVYKYKGHYDTYAPKGNYVLPPEYHLQWDLLMPVVEKINEVAGKIDIRGKYFLSRYGEDVAYTHDKIHEYVCYVMLPQAHEKVVEFIKWYNSKRRG
jgi:hypothetical protein